MFEQQQQSKKEAYSTKNASSSGGDDDEDEETCRPGEEDIGDLRFVGKDFSKRRKRAAELFCMKVQNGGKKPAPGNSGSVSHRVVKQIIQRAEKEISSQCLLMVKLAERDAKLHKNAFDREIRINFKGVDPKEFEPEEANTHVTGDLGKALARFDEKKKNGGHLSKIGSDEDEGRLKRGRTRRDSSFAVALEDVITISPDMGGTQFENECKMVRRLGQDEGIDMVVKDLVGSVTFRSLVEGFVAFGQTHSQEEEASLKSSDDSLFDSDSDSNSDEEAKEEAKIGAPGGTSAQQNLALLQDSNDVLPKGWWDKARAYQALMEEAMNLDQRYTIAEESVKALKIKSNALTEAIAVVKKSTLDTGKSLREMTEEKGSVDTFNDGMLKQSKGAVKKWERSIKDSKEHLEQRRGDLKRFGVLIKKKQLEEDEEAKRKEEEELRRKAAEAKNGKAKGKGKGKKKEQKTLPRRGGRRGENQEEEKAENELNSTELSERIQSVIESIAELEKKLVSAEKNLVKYKIKVETATFNISNANNVMLDAVSFDMLTLSQLHSAIDDYEKEKRRVGDEEDRQGREKKDIKGLMEDVI